MDVRTQPGEAELRVSTCEPRGWPPASSRASSLSSELWMPVLAEGIRACHHPRAPRRPGGTPPQGWQVGAELMDHLGWSFLFSRFSLTAIN